MPTTIASKPAAEEGHKERTPPQHQRDHGSDHTPGKPDISDRTSNSPKRIQQFRCPCEPTANSEERATRTQLLLSRSESGTDTRLECSHPLTTRLPKQTVTKGQDMSLNWRSEDLPEPHPEASLLAPRLDDTFLTKVRTSLGGSYL